MNPFPPLFDNYLALPMPILLASLLLYWGLLAVVVHRLLVPWIAGPEGRKIGRLEAEVPAQIGLAFGLLISFIAMPVWEQHSLAEQTARAEAAAYREMAEAIEDDGGDDTRRLTAAVHDTVQFIVKDEWPKLPHLLAPQVAAPPLRDLRGEIHSLSDGPLRHELSDLYKQVATARETRLRIAATRPPPARWGVVGALAMLTLLGVGLIHADSRRARRIALGMVAVGISCCFVMLFAYTRPYIGQFAVMPDDLCVLMSEMAEESSVAGRDVPPSRF